MATVERTMMLKTMRKHGVTLALFAAGSTGLTAAINELTKSTIDQQAALQQKALFDQVLPADRYNNDLLKSCYLVSAPALGKGQHKVWIAKNNDRPIGAVMAAMCCCVLPVRRLPSPTAREAAHDTRRKPAAAA